MISPLENNGMLLRTQDYSSIRHNEENQASNQHVKIQESLDKNEENVAHSVQSKDNSDGTNTHHDARDEGRNKYFNNRKIKKKDVLDTEGIVVPKTKGGFDITI